MEEKQFTWIPFYKELAKALLIYKDNRKPLVDWIYAELSKVTGGGGKSLVEYIHNRDKSNVTDIDPFSVIAIFNRNSLTIENRIAYCEKFKEMFGLKAEVPDNFDGIPTVFTMRAFFFHWDKKDRTEYLWKLLDKIVNNQDISDVFDFLIEDEMPKYTLTMLLYWVRPEQYLALDSRNRSYFQNFGFTADNTIFNYKNYMEIVDKAKVLMIDGTIDCKTFPELSYQAWKSSQTSRIWMFNGNEKTFQTSTLKMGSSANGALKFEDFNTKAAMGDAYRKSVDNKDVTIPQMYWEFIHEVKVGDIVVVFETKKSPTPQHHLLYGWGRISSEVFYDYDDDNPIIRNVEWNHPQPQEPIKETKTKNALYFHDVSGTEAANIMKLLDINEKSEVTMRNSNSDIFINLLKTNKNLILTGAPGTGKTYKAREIAKELIGLHDIKELEGCPQYGFVQFHPSYDYSDFVEGLRPKNDDNGNVSFERKDGVFKEFCARALKNEGSGNTDNFDESWNKLIEELNEKDFIDIPLVSNKGTIRIELNEYGTGLASRTYENDTFQSEGKWVNGKSKFFNKEQLYNVYRGLPGIPSGGHDNYRKAVVAYMKSFLGLKNYNKGSELAGNGKKFVFVIDEINRGEISKIFGELFFSIDPGYRGTDGKTKTQYANMVTEPNDFDIVLGSKDFGNFFVPENVYVIGTMNDIDRSVESMDFAMRRRFAWKEVTAEQSYENMIENDSKFSDAVKAEIKQRMFGLNEAITKTEGLDKSYQIGAAYFRKYLDYKDQLKPFDTLWENHLEGLLSEYLRGNRKADELLKKLRKAYNLTSADEQSANNNEG